jgi:hypothetical protein
MRAGLWALVALLVSGTNGIVEALAQQTQGDVFASQGDYDPYAVGGAHRWYDNHTDDFKKKSSGCLSLLDEAKVYQDKALALYEQARQPGNKNSSALVKQANDQIALRTKKIQAFQDCVNKATRTRPGDEFASNGDGAKGINRVPDPTSTPTPNPKPQPTPTPKPAPAPTPTVKPSPTPVQPPSLDKAIDACFKEKDPLYKPPDWNRYFLPEQLRVNSSGGFDQAFDLAAVAAEQALQIDEKEYGKWNDRS